MTRRSNHGDTAAAWTVVGEWAPWEPERIALGPDSSHLTALYCRIADQLGTAAAHGLADRAGFERILRRWCRIQPGLRGGAADSLCWCFEQAADRESERLDRAAARVRREVWPMFEAGMPRVVIATAAERANAAILWPAELDAVLAWICPRATRRRPMT